MTVAKLKPAIADGHGLTPRVVDAIYDALVAGRKVEPLVGHFMLEPVEHGERKTAAGTTRWVRFEAVRVEPLHEQNDITDARWRIEQSWDRRHPTTGTLALEIDGRSPDDQRRFLLGLIEDDWAKEQSLTPTDIKERWRTQWGIDSDSVPTDGSFPHPDYRSAEPHHLREFALMVGVLRDDDSGDKLPHEDRDDEDDDADDEPEEAAS